MNGPKKYRLSLRPENPPNPAYKQAPGWLDRTRPIAYKPGRCHPNFNRLVSSSGARTAKAQVAQLVEQRTENPRVGGSNPPLGTTGYLVSIKSTA